MRVGVLCTSLTVEVQIEVCQILQAANVCRDGPPDPIAGRIQNMEAMAGSALQAVHHSGVCLRLPFISHRCHGSMDSRGISPAVQGVLASASRSMKSCASSRQQYTPGQQQ